MAKRKKRGPGADQGPPVCFRPGADVERLVAAFAARRGVGLNEACKNLTALAVAGLDRRYAGLVGRMAGAAGGPGAFGRACVHVHTALAAVGRAGGRPAEADRMRLAAEAARDYLAARGVPPPMADLLALLAGDDPPAPAGTARAGRDAAGRPVPDPLPATAPNLETGPPPIDRTKRRRRTIRRVSPESLEE